MATVGLPQRWFALYSYRNVGQIRGAQNLHMRLYLIRHAESENNVLSKQPNSRRKVDPDLTPLGYQQRDVLARHIGSDRAAVGESFEIDHLYTSAMFRALLTTKPVSEALGLAPKVWPDLHEIGGMYDDRSGETRGSGGMSRSAIMAKFPGYVLPEAVTESVWYDVALGREPESHSHDRAIRVARALRERSESDETLALVSHAGFLDLLLKAIFELLPARTYAMSFYHGNTAITRINFDRGWTHLHYTNRADHLPAAMRSF